MTTRTIYRLRYPAGDRYTLRLDLAERWARVHSPVEIWNVAGLDLAAIEADDAPKGPTEGFVIDHSGWVAPPDPPPDPKPERR